MAQANQKNQKNKSEKIKQRLDALVRNTEEVREKVSRMKKDRKNRGDSE